MSFRPPGLVSVLADWRDKRDIITSTSGSCDPEFQLFTVVVAAVLSLPVACLLYAACLLLIVMFIIGLGILMFWGCCDEGIGSDVGIVTHTNSKICLSSAECEAQNTKLTTTSGNGSEGEEYDCDSLCISTVYTGKGPCLMLN